ncbi:hypothetical protein C923_04759 [Plasmodium falciparum UGT5.1]|uniref:Uncharacterized protein n=1 Tax=Plasmodium falciparum UGT5.1 TaxID=1237627 RepID=W7JSP1_PLAFA|nr:hypothetical protein C923_04759 [Plasmodium falciparum UGT5.1]
MFRKYFGCTGDLYVLNEIFMNNQNVKNINIYIYIYIYIYIFYNG